MRARLRRVLQQHSLQRGLRGVAAPRVGVPLARERQALPQLLRAKPGHQRAQDRLCLIRPLGQRRLHHRQQPPRLPQLERQRGRRAVVLVLPGSTLQHWEDDLE